MRSAALLILLAATPAGAQWQSGKAGPPAPRPPVIDSRASPPASWRETQDIRQRIRAGQQAGQIDRRTARGLRREALAIDAASDRYSVGGTSQAEQRELLERSIVLRDQVNAARTRGTAK